MRLSIFFTIFIALFLLSLGWGQYSMPVSKVVDILYSQITSSSGDFTQIQHDIIVNIRLPRIFMASLAGAALSLSGLVLQGVFKNPLVGPHIVGVSTGAALGGVIAIYFGLSHFMLYTLAFGFGLGALGLVYLLASFVSRTNIFTLILSGIVVGGFFGALISFIQYVSDSDDVLPNIIYWLLGSFSSANFHDLSIFALVCMPCIVILYIIRWHLNILSLEDKDIKLLGVALKPFRFFVLFLCTVLISSQVSVSGNIGWIGLVIPHVARMIAGSDHKDSVPTVILLGAIFMLLIDDIARNITTAEIPLGIITALFGAPIFAMLMKKTKTGLNDE